MNPATTLTLNSADVTDGIFFANRSHKRSKKKVIFEKKHSSEENFEKRSETIRVPDGAFFYFSF